MQKSIYNIPEMDCPSEENLIRMKLEGVEGIHQLGFDIENRRLSVFHSGENTEITKKLESLKLGAKLEKTAAVENTDISIENNTIQSRLLWTVLLINFAFFVIEITTGFISGSMGLVADSLDMLADASVYGLSLWAVGGAIARKMKVATLSGYFQLTLAGIGLMLQKSKSKEPHMKASMIFSSNDIVINFGVIVAGVLVLLTQSKYPDLIIGSIVFLIVVRGAVRILKLRK